MLWKRGNFFPTGRLVDFDSDVGKKFISRECDLIFSFGLAIVPPFRPLRGRFMRRYEGGTGCGNPRACVNLTQKHTTPGGTWSGPGVSWDLSGGVIQAPSGPAAVEGDKPSIAAWRAKVTLMHPLKDVSGLLREVAR